MTNNFTFNLFSVENVNVSWNMIHIFLDCRVETDFLNDVSLGNGVEAQDGFTVKDEIQGLLKRTL